MVTSGGQKSTHGGWKIGVSPGGNGWVSKAKGHYLTLPFPNGLRDKKERGLEPAMVWASAPLPLARLPVLQAWRSRSTCQDSLAARFWEVTEVLPGRSSRRDLQSTVGWRSCPLALSVSHRVALQQWPRIQAPASWRGHCGGHGGTSPRLPDPGLSSRTWEKEGLGRR